MTDFKLGDKVRIRHFKDGNEYENLIKLEYSRSKKTYWSYETFLNETKEFTGIYTITGKYDDFLEINYNKHLGYFQLEKVYSLKDRLALIKELLK
jgi:hypothetical protein